MMKPHFIKGRQYPDSFGFSPQILSNFPAKESFFKLKQIWNPSTYI